VSIGDQLRQTVIEWAAGIAGTAASEVERETVAAAPLGQTGELRGSIKANPPTFTGRGFETSIRAEAEHASFTDTGTRPHRIEGSPLLAFEWPKAGPGLFVFPSVEHPGTTGTGWFTEQMPERWRSALEGSL
jgi:hypothetical protein